MPDYWSVPIVPGVINDLNEQIAKGPDLSWINNLADNYFKGKDQRFVQDQRDVFKGGLPKDASGNIDWNQVSQNLAKVGGTSQVQNVIGLQNLQLGRDQMKMLGGVENGTPTVGVPPSSATSIPSQPPQVNPAQPPQAQPTNGYRGGNDSTSVISVLGANGVPDEKVGPIAIAVAGKLGKDPNEPLNMQDPNTRQVLAEAVRAYKAQAQPQGAPPGMPPSVAAPMPQPAQAAPTQAAPSFDQRFAQVQPQPQAQPYPQPPAPTRGNPPTGVDPELQRQIAIYTQLAASPIPSVAAAAKSRLEALQKQVEFTTNQKEYDLARRQGYTGTFQNFQSDMEASKAEATDLSKNLGKLADAGIEARGRLAQLTGVQQLGERVGYGAIPKIQSFLGAYGIETQGLSDIQAYERAIDFMAPQLRPIGSGRLMQQELQQFKNALGGLMTTPEGRKISLENLKLINNYAAEVGKIASDTSIPASQRYQKIYSMEPPKLNLKAPNAAPQGSEMKTWTGPSGKTYNVVNGTLVPQ